MSTPVWILLGFAAWTLIILVSTIGVYRWRSVFTHRAKLTEFTPEIPHGSDWYRRAMRAHANCVENLPIYTAIVVGILVTQTESAILNVLSIVLLIARILQSLTHIIFPLTTLSISARFTFFAIQLVCMFWMIIYLVIFNVG